MYFKYYFFNFCKNNCDLRKIYNTSIVYMFKVIFAQYVIFAPLSL